MMQDTGPLETGAHASAGTVSYGAHIRAAGILWEVCDVRSIEAPTASRETRGRLRPIDTETGERLTIVRIGRAEREMVHVDLTVYAGGEISAFPAARNYSAPLTDRQRQLILDDLAGVEFYLPPLNVDERLERFISSIATDATHAAANTITYARRRALSEHFAEIQTRPEADRHRAAILDQACAEFRARLQALLTQA